MSANIVGILTVILSPTFSNQNISVSNPPITLVGLSDNSQSLSNESIIEGFRLSKS